MKLDAGTRRAIDAAAKKYGINHLYQDGEWQSDTFHARLAAHVGVNKDGEWRYEYVPLGSGQGHKYYREFTAAIYDYLWGKRTAVP